MHALSENVYADRSSIHAEALDSLVWPPPKYQIMFLFRSCWERRSSCRKSKGQSRRKTMAPVLAAQQEKERRVTKQAAPQRAAPEPTGRVAELVRGLLATRNIEMASMDRRRH